MLRPMTAQEIEKFEDYLADVLMVWDCYEQCWIEDAPIVLRFENIDVLVPNDSCAELNASIFQCCDEGLNGVIGAHAKEADDCLCWLHRKIGADGIGAKMNVRKALESIRA